MKPFALFIISFLFIAGLMLSFYSKDIGKVHVDYQGYSRIQNMLEGIDK